MSNNINKEKKKHIQMAAIIILLMMLLSVGITSFVAPVLINIIADRFIANPDTLAFVTIGLKAFLVWFIYKQIYSGFFWYVGQIGRVANIDSKSTLAELLNYCAFIYSLDHIHYVRIRNQRLTGDKVLEFLNEKKNVVTRLDGNTLIKTKLIEEFHKIATKASPDSRINIPVLKIDYTPELDSAKIVNTLASMGVTSKELLHKDN